MTSVPVLRRSEILAALQQSSSIDAAAKRIGVGVVDLRKLAYEHHMASAYLRLAGVPGKNGRAHPQFVDMGGFKLYGDGGAPVLVVIDRAQNQGNGCAVWNVRFEACGHRDRYQGIALRDYSRKLTAPSCRQCKAASKTPRP